MSEELVAPIKEHTQAPMHRRRHFGERLCRTCLENAELNADKAMLRGKQPRDLLGIILASGRTTKSVDERRRAY